MARGREARVEFVCVGLCEEPPTWMVDGRFNAEGEFEPDDVEYLDCPECLEPGEPTDHDVTVGDV